MTPGAAGAQRRKGDDEKISTTAVNPITWLGIVLIRRYSKGRRVEGHGEEC
jgi:hypothetical protein